MFDLEKAIGQWRQELKKCRFIQDGDAVDLEAYLRDKIDEGICRGLDPEAAFTAARAEFAYSESLDNGYRQARARRSWLPLFWRNLRVVLRLTKRQKVTAFISIGGLAVGLAAALFVALFVRFEYSFDRYHRNAGRIFRVTGEDYSGIPYQAADGLRRSLPEIQDVAVLKRLTPLGDPVLVTAGERKIGENRVYITEQDFFRIFSVDFLFGRPETALADPQSAVLTESAARRYFGTTDCLGRAFGLARGSVFRVDAVVRDFPLHSHFIFNVLIRPDAAVSLEGSDDRPYWGSWNYRTYLLLKPGISEDAVARKIPLAFPESLRKRNAGKFNDVSKLRLQALGDIHWASGFRDEFEAGGDIRSLRLIAIVGLLILISSIFNFVNLATARSLQRRREVGMRKVLGAGRGGIVRQFLGEALIQAGIAAVLAVGLLYLAFPALSRFSGTRFTWAQVSWPFLLAVLAGSVLTVGLAAGVYPSLTAARFQPVRSLQGEEGDGGRKTAARNVLLAFQLVVSCGLVIAALVFKTQLGFLRNKDLGISGDLVINIRLPEALRTRSDILKREILERPGILAVTASNFLIGENTNYQGFDWEGKRPETDDMVRWIGVDADFAAVFGLKIVEGRTFQPEDAAAGEKRFLINESAARAFGWDRPVGRWMALDVRGAQNRIGRVVGVIKDFHFRSFYHALEPLVLLAAPPRMPLDPGKSSREFSFFTNLAVKISGRDFRRALEAVQAFVLKNIPEDPGAWSFFDDDIGRVYARELNLSRLFTGLSFLAAGLAGMGVFGLSAFLIERRRKEICIRKILGASTGSLVAQFSSGFLRLLAFSAVVAVPVVFWLLREWLGRFAYRISLGPWFFAGGILFMAGLLIAAVGINAVRAAAANPAPQLRGE